MIWPREAVLLARTKLKTRKIRLIVTVVITSLLFGVLVFIASVTQGVIGSLQSFGKEGYGGKYYVQAQPLTYQMGGGNDEQILRDAMEGTQRDLIAQKKAAAKKLGLTYDETTDQSLPLSIYKNGGTTNVYPNYGSKYITDYVAARNRAIPGTSYEDFIKTAKAAGATEILRGTQSGAVYGMSGDTGGQTSVLIDGKEDYLAGQNGRSGPPDTTGVASITSLGWRSADAAILQPFVLSGQTMITGKDGSIPVVAPFSAAQEVLGLKPLPATATSQQKIDRLVAVRSGVAGKTAQLCYRNGASAELVNQTVQQNKDIANNKNNKDYTPPALQYNLPATGCGETTVKSDKRTAEEKKTAANQLAFDTQFGLYQAPEQGIITVRVIGVNADVDYSASISPTTVLTSLLTSSLGAGWISPAKPIEENRLAMTVQGGTATTADPGRVAYYAQFPTLAQMTKFIDDQTCKGLQSMTGPDGNKIAIDVSQGADTANCIQQGKVLTVGPYGNSAGAVEQFRSGIWKVARFAVLIVVVLASLVLMGNVGKIIADSRRETAVFRSLGAKRLDIAQIYLTYTLLISLLIATGALVLGSVAAAILSNRFSAELSTAAVIAYNAQDVTKTFSLAGFNLLYVLVITGLIVLAGLLSASLPLLTNTRRNPIRDMRDDS